MLVNLLIVFFLLLIIYQIFFSRRMNIYEGLENGETGTGTTEYKDYADSNDAMILSQQNAGNISYLKERIDDLSGLQNTVMDICGNILLLNQQVQGLIQQQADAQQQLVGNQPVEISGTY